MGLKHLSSIMGEGVADGVQGNSERGFKYQRHLEIGGG